MEINLKFKDENLLTDYEKGELDKLITNIIEENRNNSHIISKLVIEGTNLLRISDARFSELAEQNMARRFLGNITGKNRKLQNEANNNIVRAQYCSEQLILKLSQQNLMTVELITAVNNNLNSSVLELKKEISGIYERLPKMLKQTRSNLLNLDSRISKTERDLELLKWVELIKYQCIDGIEYWDLSQYEKIFYLAYDFYRIKKGNFEGSDMFYLKKAIDEIGLSPNEKIRYVDFIKHICEHERLCSRYVNVPFEILEKIEDINTVISESIIKYKLIMEEDKNKAIHRVNKDVKNEKYLMISDYIKETMFIDIESEISIFDLVLELLLSINMINEEINYVCSNIDFKNMSDDKLNMYIDYGIEEAKKSLEERTYERKIEDIFIEDLDFEQILKHAENGNYKAQKYLGDYYFYDKDNNEKAIYWYQNAVESERPEYEYALGEVYYFNGEYLEAYNYYERAAKRGFLKAQLMCGELSEKETELEKAIYWYKNIYESGSVEGLFKLGKIYENKEYDKRDMEKAIKCYKVAAEKEYVEAEYVLGMIYKEGSGVKENMEEAVKYFEKAAFKNHEKSLLELGIYYLRDKEHKNFNKAEKYLMKARDNGNINAEVYLQEVKVEKKCTYHEFECELATLEYKYLVSIRTPVSRIISSLTYGNLGIKDYNTEVLNLLKKYNIVIDNIEQELDKILIELMTKESSSSLSHIAGIGSAIGIAVVIGILDALKSAHDPVLLKKYIEKVKAYCFIRAKEYLGIQ